MLRIDDFVKGQLVLTAWRYSQMYGQGGHLCGSIVAACLCNRARLGWGTHLEVIERAPLYAAELEQPIGYPKVWEPCFMKLCHEIEGIYDGSIPDVSKGGLYFCDLRHIETDFFINKILANPEEHPRIVDMNSFAVFR